MILLIGVLLATGQVYSASMVYVQYVQVRQKSLHGELGSIIRPMRKSMRGPTGVDERQEALEAFLDDHYENGVRYVGFRSPRDRQYYEAGERDIAPFFYDMLEARDFSPTAAEMRFQKGRVFAYAPGLSHIFQNNTFNAEFSAVKQRGTGKFRTGQLDKTIYEELTRPDSVPIASMSKAEIERILSYYPPIQVVEMEPKATLAMRNRTLAILAVGILGALVTLLGAIYIWWLIGKKQRAEREAEEKRMLATLGKMSAVISHELRNPLAGAKGQIELLEMMLYDDKHVERAGRIRSELERLEELSETLLSFVNSRRIEPAVYECSQLVNDLKSLARDKRLEVDTSQMPAEWRYDAITLVRAVDNLVSNALSFTPADGKVYLRLWKEDERLHISVRDEGPGFPAEMDDMFEPFVTTRIKGTGLGMAIAAEVVRAHGGEITAQNHPDGGAFIQLWLPRSHLG